MHKKPEDMSVEELRKICLEAKLRGLTTTEEKLYVATIRFELAKRGETP